jgi:hypothetical protein
VRLNAGPFGAPQGGNHRPNVHRSNAVGVSVSEFVAWLFALSFVPIGFYWWSPKQHRCSAVPSTLVELFRELTMERRCGA